MSSQADIIALLVASYGRPVETTPAVTAALSTEPKAKKAKAPKAVKEAAPTTTASDPRPMIPRLALPEKGTLEARGYFMAMRRAVTRDERIFAIAAFVGYDLQGEYASQEMAASMTARHAIQGNPVALTRPVHSAGPTLAGYVSGLPMPVARHLADLAARERMAGETKADHFKAESLAVSEENRHYHSTFADVEGERLAQIRADLAAM